MMSILGRVVGSGIASKSRKFSSAAPWLMLPPSFRGRSEMVYNWYSPSKEEVVRFKGKGGKEEADVMRDEATTVVGSSHGWLALLNKRSGDMLLANPLSGRRKKLPPFRPLKEEEEEEDGDLFKVIISCSADEEGCRALMMPWCVPEERVVSFCCPGRSDGWWAPIKTSSGIDFRINLDFAYSTARRGFFGCVQTDMDPRRRVLEGWDMSGGDGFPRRMMDRPDMDMFGEGPTPERNHAYLAPAEHSDQLYVVRLYVEDAQSLHFDVLRSTSDGGGLELCSSLDGLVLFVGSNHSMALPSSQFPHLKPNSIYLSDHRLQSGQPFIGIFDYQNRSWSPCCYPPALQLQNFASQYPLTWFTPTFD